MKYFLAITILVNVNSCLTSSKDSVKIKKEITRHYSTITKPISYEIKKKEIELSTESGFDKQENQTYSINYLGNSQDTTWYTIKNTKRKVDDKTCFYRDSILIYCRVKKNDTIRLFFPPNLDKPAPYTLYDQKGAIGGIYPYIHEKYSYKKSFVTERKFDPKGNLTYYVETQYYLPKEFSLEKNQKNLTKKKDLIQAGLSKIIEMEYEYYE